MTPCGYITLCLFTAQCIMRKHSHLFIVFFFGLYLWSCTHQHGQVENLIIKGSDTEVNLALALAETYMMKDPNISIAVSGGGSGAGIAALINGKTDIANASRPMKTEELLLAQERGVWPIATVLGMDAVAIVVHPKCPLKELSKQDLGAIYRGKIHNWKQLGGPDQEISLYGRQSNSGTFVYFRDSILQAEYSPKVKQMNGTAQIVEAIKTDASGIGYVGVGYILEKNGNAAKGIKVLAIKSTAHTLAYSPALLENIQQGNYPIIRPLFQYTDGKPKGKLLQFLRYCLSEEGQALVQQNGYFPVSKMYREQNELALTTTYAKSSLH